MAKYLKKQILGEGRFLRLVSQNGWEYALRPKISGIVVMIPITENDEIILVEQHRVPVGASVIELPAGLAGDIPGRENEALVEAAQRELEEETGYQARSFELMMSGPPSPGISSEIVHIYLATQLKKVGSGGGDDSEDITVHCVPCKQIQAWLKEKADEGALIDPKVYMGAWFARIPF